MNPGMQVILLNDDNLHEHIKREKPANYEVLAPTLKSCWVRINSVLENGGCWMDATAFHFRPLHACIDFGADISGLHLHDSQRPTDWFFFAQRGSPLMEAWRDELDIILGMDPNAWSENLRHTYPAMEFHALPYYIDGWALWKVMQDFNKKGVSFNVVTQDNLPCSYSFLYEGDDWKSFMQQFPEQHCMSRRLDLVTYEMEGGNADTPEIVPAVSSELIWNNLFRMDCDKFLKQKPETCFAKFTAVHRLILEDLFRLHSADEVNPDSVVGKCVPNWDILFS